MDKGFSEEIRKASGATLDADELPVFERLDELPDALIETARRLESRISAVRLIKYCVPGAPLGEVNEFVAQVIEGPKIPAAQWRRDPLVVLRADLELLASLEAGEIQASFDGVESGWFVRDADYMAWRLGDAESAPFKVARGQHESWQPASPLLASMPNPHQDARSLDADEVCEALARWLVSTIAFHLDRSRTYPDADAVVGELQKSSAMGPATPSGFFVRCCELVVREFEAAGPRQVPGYVGPSSGYAGACGG